MRKTRTLEHRTTDARRRTLHLIIFALVLVAFAPSPSHADEKSAISAATQSASAWLAQVDRGDYAGSWDAASTMFHNGVSREAWEQKAAAVRGPLGRVVTRELASAHYATSLPGAPDGQYVVIQYRTAFAHKKSAIETVTPMLDSDGRWRVSGYYIR